MLGQIAGAQIEIEAVIAELARTGASADGLTQQLHALQHLQREIGAANPAALAALRTEISVAVTTSGTVAQQGRASADTSAAVTPADRVAAARQAIEGVAADYYDAKRLDPYLKFASPADEEAYRRRERENKEAIEHELAKGTPEGVRNAQRIMQQQLVDAGAHGADASPDFQRMMSQARNAEAELQKAEEVDKHPAPSGQRAATTSGKPASELDEALAALRAAGVTADGPQDAATHGLREVGTSRSGAGQGRA